MLDIHKPHVGLGTWKAPKGEVFDAVRYAIVECGYRHIDCAEVYGNQKEIGDALQNIFKTTSITREQLFITSKVFNNHHRSRVAPYFEQTLKDLQLSYVDLYLMHWPFEFEDEEIPTPMRLENGNPNPLIKISVEYLETWKELEKLKESGRAKHVGVSNFTVNQLTDLVSQCKIKPEVHQIEIHPNNIQPDMIKYCNDQNIMITAYSPLGQGNLLKDDTIKKNCRSC